MNKADLEQVDPAMEMENLQDAVTEMSEVASNLDYWSGLLVQVLHYVLSHLDRNIFKLSNVYDEYSPPLVQVRKLQMIFLNHCQW